ncbi:hypothetical protein [Streptomyces kronopolitis]|uniref:hypothetical protein n=1 Tax=Streptomyces kronopolitis TaxID=1612435 RepID=UPI0036826E6D
MTAVAKVAATTLARPTRNAAAPFSGVVVVILILIAVLALLHRKQTEHLGASDSEEGQRCSRAGEPSAAAQHHER